MSSPQSILFYERPCLAPSKSDTVCVAFHPIFPQLAVGCSNGAVNMFVDDGEKHEATIKREGFIPISLAWHPLNKALLIGWDDGNITLFSEVEKRLSEPPRIHEPCKVNFVRWTETGERVITGDEKGNVCLWNVAKVNVTSAGKYTKDPGSPLTHMVFRTRIKNKEKNFFFFGGAKGNIYFAIDDNATIKQVATVGEDVPISFMFYWVEKDQLIVTTKTGTLFRWSVAPDGKLEQMKKVSEKHIYIVLTDVQQINIAPANGLGAEDQLFVEWIGDGLIALGCSNDCIVRFLDIEKDNSLYTLGMALPDDRPSAISYDPHTQSLAISNATNKTIQFWRYSPLGQGSKAWTSLPNEISLPPKPSHLVWGPLGVPVLAVGLADSVTLIHQSPPIHLLYNRTAAFQVSSSKITMQKHSPPSNNPNEKNNGPLNPVSLTPNIPFKGFALHEENLVVYSSKRVEVYEVKEDLGVSGLSNFRTAPLFACAVAPETIACCLSGRVEMCTFQGVCKQTLVFGEGEGDPVQVHINGNFMIVLSNKNVIKCYDLSRREARQIGHSRSFQEKSNIGRILKATINSGGTHVALLTEYYPENCSNTRAMNQSLFVYEIERDAVLEHKFAPHTPIKVSWDLIDARLLGVSCLEEPSEEGMVATPREGGEMIHSLTTLFVAPDSDETVFQDRLITSSSVESLLGLTVPHVYFVSTERAPDASPKIETKVMRDFAGMENCDVATRDAILNFSYFLAIGNMDEAYKAVKLIKNSNVWENMAIMCVKTKRIDVAEVRLILLFSSEEEEVCLANMGNARGTRALREAKKLPLEAQLALVAIELGQLDEAEELYKSCGRWDLVNKLQQARNDWKGAVLTANKQDRIHLRTTYYQYAKYLESIGDFTGAVKQFEESETHRHEVPRMLFKAKNFEDLETYIDSMKDNSLLEWWARYAESKGLFDKAIQYYQRAQDYLSLVRIYCFQGRLEEACKIAIESNDTGAAYHVGRTLENNDQLQDAIRFYAKAKCFNHGIRLAIEQDFEQEVFDLALQSNGSRIMLESGKYFEDRQQMDRAVILFHKGGALGKAVELCFQAGLYDQLGSITDDLTPNTDPELITKCCDFFLNHNRYDKAVTLYITGCQVSRALEVALNNRINITEAMCDRMINLPIQDQAKKEAMFKEIAKAVKKQGSYHLATKMYTLAREKDKAMKVLLRSGDTEKIVFFANKSRQPELYIMAANYLQSLEWRSQPEIMKSIITFYTKAKSPDSLALFFVACAQVEIDDFKNYEKALGALNEAGKYMSKSKIPTKEAKLQMIKRKAGAVENFLNVRSMFRTNPDDAMLAASNMCEVEQLEDIVRLGDVYAMLIEYLCSQDQLDPCMEVIARMKQQKISMFRYLNKDMVIHIYRGTGTPIDFPTDEDQEQEEIEDNT
ncbi:intraflagellar transport protein [Planoprotostelium fungivorum]|uniref:Intraflagellar transport protein n=1 Tax=Planoprotostelium fungivorum TaxID=1890364 RepID=A0A2P6P0D5_9EUKA|nr:intraflagellar transport protein [Planoprotostelium fungivorum]